MTNNIFLNNICNSNYVTFDVFVTDREFPYYPMATHYCLTWKSKEFINNANEKTNILSLWYNYKHHKKSPRNNKSCSSRNIVISCLLRTWNPNISFDKSKKKNEKKTLGALGKTICESTYDLWITPKSQSPLP